MSKLSSGLATKAALEGFKAPGTSKFRRAKALFLLSEQRPATLLPHFADFRRLFEADNKFIQWTALRIIANVAPVSDQRRIARLLDDYLAPIPGPVMITAANAITGAAKIAASHPKLAGKIITAILQVEQARYRSDECRNIAIGHAIIALATLDQTNPNILALVQRQLGNPAPPPGRKPKTL